MIYFTQLRYAIVFGGIAALTKLTLKALFADIERLSVKMRLRKAQLAEETRTGDLKDREVLMLEFLGEKGNMSIVELTKSLRGIAQSTVSADVKHLRLDLKLVDLRVPEDGRVHLVELTEIGKQRLQQIRDERLKTYACVLHAIPQDKHKLEVLSKVVQKAIEKLDSELASWPDGHRDQRA